MSDGPLIIIGIIVILILVGIILVLIAWKKKKEGKYKEPNYQAFFIMGICFLSSGIIFLTTVSPAFIGFTVMGLCYMAIGLANREKWKKKENWK
jgi:hypothetical protein